ncbi:conserved membrane hypothetical protein [Rhodospirillaceae bacterium LM-1]|nr:conserved membrane hypothetical protein [Rhodospirillaceae bacterium LM-1]
MSLRWLLSASFLLVAVSQAGAVLSGVTPLLSGRLVDGDCYIRLARVEALLGGQGWYDATTALLNAPYGEVLHWTRLFDLLIALAALPFLPWLGVEPSVWLAGLWISPLLELAAVGALVWGLRAHLSSPAILLAVALFVFQPGIVGVFLPARPDHHGLQIALEIWALAGLMRPGARSAAWAGLASGLALWVSAEALLLILAAGLCLGLMWILEGEGQRKRLLAYLLSLCFVVASALALERPPAMWLAQEYDRLSLVQLGLCCFLTLSVGWTFLGNDWADTTRRRLLLGLGMAAMAGGLMALVFPQFFRGPYGNLDPRLVPVWFSLVKEAQPLAFGPKAVLLLAPPLMGLIYAAWRCWREPSSFILISLCALLVYVPAMFYQVRIAVFAAAADVLPWTLLALAALRMGRLRVLAVPLVLVGPLAAAAFVAKMGLGQSDPGAPDICSWDRLAHHFKTEWPDDRQPILTYIFPGPELAYLSGHPVVAGPYHRSTEGILDIVNALGAMDDAPAHEVVLRRNIGWVAVCDRESEGLGFNARNGQDGFHARLARGIAPNWLAAMESVATAKGTFQIYRVSR